MITAVAQFRLLAGTTLAQARKIYESTAPRYLGDNGLILKFYIFDAEAGIGGGCYVFRDRAAADAMLDADWRAFVTGKYGAPPDVRFFETPVFVDNRSGRIEIDAAD